MNAITYKLLFDGVKFCQFSCDVINFFFKMSPLSSFVAEVFEKDLDLTITENMSSCKEGCGVREKVSFIQLINQM